MSNYGRCQSDGVGCYRADCHWPDQPCVVEPADFAGSSREEDGSVGNAERAAGSANFMKHERMPADYKRDVNGRVSKAEMNRYLPRWRCSTCGQWLLGDEFHTVDHCAQRVNLDA